MMVGCNKNMINSRYMEDMLMKLSNIAVGRQVWFVNKHVKTLTDTWLQLCWANTQIYKHRAIS